MYIDEDAILDLRLNYLDRFVNQFVIAESQFTHSGEKRKLLFDINKFKKFKHKITYLSLDHEPQEIDIVNNQDSERIKSHKYILNGYKRDNYQRNYLSRGIKDAEPNDIIMISDIDEIPKLEDINFKSIKNRLIFFQQKMFYYKFNLCLKDFIWVGTKTCRKKNLITPQWLRNIKDKAYPFWRLDVLFSKNKYQDICFVKNGGWHFSFLKNAQDIEKKLKTYTHHWEYDIKPLGVDKIEQMIKEKKTVYDLKVDMKSSQFGKGQNLDTVDLDQLPSYIQNNLDKYKLWLD
jgi:beta-1,4-mannosyl-glycoprotein beta-1,4-N-acetylglucosaminyltransferase